MSQIFHTLKVTFEVKFWQNKTSKTCWEGLRRGSTFEIKLTKYKGSRRKLVLANRPNQTNHEHLLQITWLSFTFQITFRISLSELLKLVA